MATPSEPRFSQHVWVCDGASEGGAHVLTHVTSAGLIQWREVSGAMDRVVCGASEAPSLVCGIRKKHLYIRTGISPSKPLGQKWAYTGCEAVDIAVGTSYILVKSSSNELTAIDFGRLTIDLSKPAELLGVTGWVHVTVEKKSFLSMFVMDTSDNLYGFTRKGDVYMCVGLRDHDRMPQWKKVKSYPTDYSLGSIFSSVSSLLGRQTAQPMFHCTSVGKGCLWCLQSSPLTLWQLVLPPSPQAGEEQWKWSNWVKFSFTGDMTPTLICGDPRSSDTLFAISENRDTIFRLFLSSSTVECQELPFHGLGEITLTSLSLSTVKDTSPPPRLYPKLPNDLCCENSSCAFCQSKMKLSSQFPENQELRSYLKRGSQQNPSSLAKQTKFHSETEPRESAGSSNSSSIAGKKRGFTYRLEDEEQFYTCWTTLPARKKQKKGIVGGKPKIIIVKY